jgi:hypothetical protein
MKKRRQSCFVVGKIGAAVRHKQMTGEDSVSRETTEFNIAVRLD